MLYSFSHFYRMKNFTSHLFFLIYYFILIRNLYNLCWRIYFNFSSTFFFFFSGYSPNFKRKNQFQVFFFSLQRFFLLAQARILINLIRQHWCKFQFPQWKQNFVPGCLITLLVSWVNGFVIWNSIPFTHNVSIIDLLQMVLIKLF